MISLLTRKSVIKVIKSDRQGVYLIFTPNYIYLFNFRSNYLIHVVENKPKRRELFHTTAMEQFVRSTTYYYEHPLLHFYTVFFWVLCRFCLFCEWALWSITRARRLTGDPDCPVSESSVRLRRRCCGGKCWNKLTRS